jgi:hypothetical protein
MARRGRPSTRPFAEKVCDFVVERLFFVRDRDFREKKKPKGQHRISVPFQEVCEYVAKKLKISARTVEAYYYRHRSGAKKRFLAKLAQRLRDSDKAWDVERKQQVRQYVMALRLQK